MVDETLLDEIVWSTGSFPICIVYEYDDNSYVHWGQVVHNHLKKLLG